MIAGFDLLRNEMSARFATLQTEMCDGFASVADATEENNKHVDERLTTLEQHLV